MNDKFYVKPLFIFEMANNHSGSVEHGLSIIRKIHGVIGPFKADFDFGFKLQYRHLDTFIHPDFKKRNDFKYIKRFSETRLSPEELRILRDEIKNLGFMAVCTPYDEKSVDLLEQHGFDIIKIASVSFTDWPLLERIIKTNKPIIASTAGASLDDIDKVVSFFEHRDKQLSLMHCVAAYPTQDNDLQLNQIDLLKSRYPQVRVGYSTHENPDNIDAVKLAVAKGAMIFEKHVGLSSETVKLNGYSALPEQVRKWLESALMAFKICGVVGQRTEFTAQEKDNLISLRRGVFAGHEIKKGEKIGLSDVFFAMPVVTGQIAANDFSKYTLFHASVDINANQAVLFDDVKCTEIRSRVYKIVQQIKAFLKKSKVVVQPQLDLEISHHYGIGRFSEFGAAIINCVNREYCRKLIIMLPGQAHPEQHHKVKEETFIILYGDVQVAIEGVEKEYKMGDAVTIEKGSKHSFKSKNGVVIEEISTTHYGDDSYYTDPAINENPDRKTSLTFWLD